MYFVHHQKKDYFCIQSHEFDHVCYDCIHYTLSVFSSLEDQATKILEDYPISNIEHYPILSDAVYDSDLFDKLCHLCRFKIVTKLIKHKLHFLDKQFIVSKNASYI